MHKVIHIFLFLKEPELALQDITLVGVMLLTVGGCSHCHTGVIAPVSPLTQLLSLQVKMDLVSALSVDRVYTRGVKEKWMTLSITNSHSLNSYVPLLT